jgi:hypothetical protein
MSRTQQRIAIYGGGFALLVVLGLIGAYLGSTQTAEQPQEAPGPLSTPAEGLADCPWGQASCVLGVSIERALQFGNVDAVMSFTEPDFYDCPGRPQQKADEPFPLCDGVPEFTRLEGYPIARRYSEHSIVDAASLRAFLQRFVDSVNPDARDEVGDGRLRLYAFGCPERAPPLLNVSCTRLAIVLSGIVGQGEDAHRELLVFWAVGQFRGETLPVTEVWDGVILDDEYPVLFQSGGYISDLGDVYVIDQSLREPPK